MDELTKTILDKLANGHTQKSIAATYAALIRQQLSSTDWPMVNAAIKKRWPGKTALVRVKEMAWRNISVTQPKSV